MGQALPGGQVQTPLGPGDEAWRKEQERKGGVQWFLQKTGLIGTIPNLGHALLTITKKIAGRSTTRQKQGKTMNRRYYQTAAAPTAAIYQTPPFRRRYPPRR